MNNSGCPRCEGLPGPLSGPGELLLRFPIPHSLVKARNLLGSGATTLGDDVLALRVVGQELSLAMAPLAELLTSREREATRAIYFADGRPPQRADYLEANSFEQLYSRAQSGWLLDLLREGRFQSHYQPIVPAGRPDHAFAYESLLRVHGSDGPIAPARVFDVARGADLLAQTDLAARQSAISGAAQHAISAKVFVNFTPSSIYDPASCLKSTVALVDRLNLPHEQLVFEVVESEHISDVAHLRNILDYYRGAGFGVALDDVGAGFSNLNVLNDLRPDYVKVDMHLVRGVDRDPYKALIAGKLLETIRGLGLRSIVEGVETAGEFAWARECGADYVQGYFISRPGTPPPALNQAR